MEAFGHTISHDLKAPLRAIKNYSAMLCENPAPNPETAQGYLNRINRNAARMDTLIDDVMNYSRATRLELNHKPIGMDALVREVLGLILVDSDGRYEIKIGDIRDTDADEAMIREVWTNLISNAIKYSSKQLKPVIEIGSLIQENEIIYYVRDNGAGFDMKYMPRGCSGFSPACIPSPEFEGTGAGLSIVKKIVDRHGGRVWADGVVGEGATFYFSLPDTTRATAGRSQKVPS